MHCNNCGADISKSLERVCSTCGEDIGFPNVRQVGRQEERDALEKRYLDAVNAAKANGRDSALKSFAEAAEKTCAVINLNLDHLHDFLTQDNLLYSTYALQVTGQIRKPAESQDDRNRRMAEALLFGHYGEEIRYAALSLDGTGLESYGPYAMMLKEIAIAKRAVLLEKNSFHFITQHNLQFGQAVPLGYRAVWQERHKLAVAKLAGEISSKTLPDEYPGILLFSDGNRETDRFIEVHIYGAFDNKAVESVKGKSSARNKSEEALLESIKDTLANAGKRWIEE